MRKMLVLLGVIFLCGCAHSPNLTADVRITSLQDQLASARAESKHNYNFAVCLGQLYRYRIARLVLDRQGLLVSSCKTSYEGYGRLMKDAVNSYREYKTSSFLNAVHEYGKERKLWKQRLDNETVDFQQIEDEMNKIGAEACTLCEGQWGRLNNDKSLPQGVQEKIKEFNNAKEK